MNRTVAVLAVLALFVSGVVIGALAMHLYYAERLVRPGAPPVMATRLLTGYLERRLDLSPDQRRRIGRIVEESRIEAANLRRRMRPEVEDLIERTHERIVEVLSAEQRRRFEEMRRLDRRRMEQALLGPVGPRHGGLRGRPGPPDRRRPPSRPGP